MRLHLVRTAIASLVTHSSRSLRLCLSTAIHLDFQAPRPTSPSPSPTSVTGRSIYHYPTLLHTSFRPAAVDIGPAH